MNRALLIAVVAASSCSPPQAQYVCGPGNCSGCCVGSDICDPGTTDVRCGKGGGFCNTCSGSSPLCVDQACNVEPMPADAKLVFVTRGTYSGDLGGITGADGLCAAAAASGSLPGTYRAWLSTTSGTVVNAFDRITGNGPWYLPGTNSSGRRTRVFANKAALRAAPLAPIDRTELGLQLTAGTFVWTGTQATGNAAVPTGFYDASCKSWTDGSSNDRGDVGDVYGGWTNEGPRSCSDAFPLYCFQQ